MNKKYRDYALMLKALGDETRLKVMGMLSKGERCACELLEEFHITQPTLSYHMKMLVKCKLVNVAKKGSWMRYRINEDISKNLIAFLSRTMK
ncbi:MAG: metalloregulator ArsR/SmtB family transcription factor [Endomicrobia bacterium]|nr:metalloregulator ArsR/SmtB family transcription factor [Endomicrobiia bacterium]MCL2799319.1 metalloregulator ArsR/SmtB family transcription factor [Endomicrobiia bacterium]